jgi:hypothetical protein
MRLVRYEDVSFRIEDVCLALLQDILAEAYATRRLLWESVVRPQLRAAGIDAKELERQFALAEARARNHAYGEAERIKQSQKTENEIALSERSETRFPPRLTRRNRCSSPAKYYPLQVQE